MPETNSRYYIFITILFVLAIVLRVTGLLGFVHNDEHWAIPARILAGELSASVYFYPPLFFYLCAGCYVLLFMVGRLTGVWYSTTDFRAQYFTDLTPFIFTGRLLSAFLGALTVPLAVLIARRLSVGWKLSLLVGLMVCLLPVDVYMSHIAKSDAAAATAVLFLAWSILRKLDEPDARIADFLIGLASALAMSFKQTSVFVVIISVVGMALVLSRGNRVPLARIARGLVITLVTAVLAWIPMNIGILLAPKSFFEYQTVLRQMYSKRDPVVETLMNALQTLGSNVVGYTVAGLAAGFLGVFFRHDRKFLVVWASSMVSILTFSLLASRRILPHHYLPPGVLLFTLGCIATVSLIERRGLLRIIGLIGSAAILGCTMIGSFQVVRQAMRAPIKFQVAEALQKTCRPEHDKILTATPEIGLPVSPEATKAERARHERLAVKYGVKLPEQPPEREPGPDRPRGGILRPRFPLGHGRHRGTGRRGTEGHQAVCLAHPARRVEARLLDRTGLQYLCRVRRRGHAHALR